MEERQVTVDTETHPLGTPFMVIATQNPIEHEGTYPLPEAQLDRFMLRLSIGYPSPEVEAEILATHSAGAPARRHRARHRRAGRRRDDRAGPRGARRADPPPLHRRPGRGHPATTATSISAPAHGPSLMILRAARAHGRRRRARLRDPRRREGARGPGARAPDHRDRRRGDERPLARGDPPGDPRRGRRCRSRRPDATGRGVTVFVAGLAMWVAARIVGSAGPRGRRRSASSSSRSSRRCSRAGDASGSRDPSAALGHPGRAGHPRHRPHRRREPLPGADLVPAPARTGSRRRSAAPRDSW